MLVLSAADLEQVLQVPQLTDSLETAFREVSAAEAVMPVRLDVHVPGEEGDLLVMPAYLPRSSALATKLVSLFPNNPGRGLPFVMGLVVLNDASTGAPLAVMDGGIITAIRTGCASAVSTRALAAAEAEILTIVGAGVQARSHLRALACVRPPREVRVVSLHVERAHRLAEEAERWLAAPVQVMTSVEAAVRDATLVATTTTATEPVLKGAWLAPGTHVCAVGAFGPAMRELDSDVLERAGVIAVDTRSGCLAEAEDIRIPLGEGRITQHQVAELGEILLERHAGRTSADQVTVYKSVGMAAMDAAAAALAYRQACASGLGVDVAL